MTATRAGAAAPAAEHSNRPSPPRPTGAQPVLDPPDDRPLYARVLRLRHTVLARWHAVLLLDVMIVLGVLLALAEVASAWAPVVLPLAVGVTVKLYDVLAGMAGPLPGERHTGRHRAVARHAPHDAPPR